MGEIMLLWLQNLLLSATHVSIQNDKSNRYPNWKDYY